MIRARLGVLAAGVLAAVVLAPVTGADAAGTGKITGIGGKYLDAAENSSANGTRLQIWTCAGTANQVMSATGVDGFTMAFVLSNGYCAPAWDGQRPLTGGVDQSTIASIRNAGGDVVPSFGGWSGHKLEESCSSAGELANAYQKVIDAYGLSAIDIDLEASAYDNPTVQQRTVDALKLAKSRNPGLHVAVTIGTGQQGPDRSLINRAAASGLTVDAWTIMPFNFGGNGQDMGALSTQAAEGLKAALKSAYGYSDAAAYDRMGISSMNGTTDVGENVTLEDFGQMRSYAEQHGLARLTFWSVNRDPGLDYTRAFAQYDG